MWKVQGKKILYKKLGRFYATKKITNAYLLQRNPFYLLNEGQRFLNEPYA